MDIKNYADKNKLIYKIGSRLYENDVKSLHLKKNDYLEPLFNDVLKNSNYCIGEDYLGYLIDDGVERYVIEPYIFYLPKILDYIKYSNNIKNKKKIDLTNNWSLEFDNYSNIYLDKIFTDLVEYEDNSSGYDKLKGYVDFISNKKKITKIWFPESVYYDFGDIGDWENKKYLNIKNLFFEFNVKNKENNIVDTKKILYLFSIYLNNINFGLNYNFNSFEKETNKVVSYVNDPLGYSLGLIGSLFNFKNQKILKLKEEKYYLEETGFNRYLDSNKINIIARSNNLDLIKNSFKFKKFYNKLFIKYIRNGNLNLSITGNKNLFN